MIYGTSHFETRNAAIEYYRAYEREPAKAVTRKLLAREIHIGEPRLKPGQRLAICRSEGRYFIED